MTATDVIDQIRGLEPKERAKVLSVLLEIEAAHKTGELDDQSFDRVADLILGRHPDLLRKPAE